MSYRVELPIFSGPMDLLLHLVKQQEVDIHDVKIATVIDHYLAHMDVLEALDLADLGDFVVMASALMEIKSRELLPREEVDFADEFDPRDDLIRRLLEYKRYRDISRRMARMMERSSEMVQPVIYLPKEFEDARKQEKTFDIGNIEIWDLTEAFARLLEETGSDKTLTFDVAKRTVDFYAQQILDRTRGKSNVDFRSLFNLDLGRYELIGVFTAMLEMMKQGYLRAEQNDETGGVTVAFCGTDEVTVEQILRGDHQGFDANSTWDDAPLHAPSVRRAATNGISRNSSAGEAAESVVYEAVETETETDDSSPGDTVVAEHGEDYEEVGDDDMVDDMLDDEVEDEPSTGERVVEIPRPDPGAAGEREATAD